MNTSPIKIQRGMTRQLQAWRDTVARPGHRLGWKIGFNMQADQQRLNLPSAMLGFLSNERCIRSGGRYQAPANSQLLVEPEVAILIGRDVPAGSQQDQAPSAIAAYSAALELVDTTRSVNDDMEAILAGNLFHDSVILSEQRLPAHTWCRDQLAFSLCLNGHEVRTLDQARVPTDFAHIILTASNILAEQGEQLRNGDWIITGAAASPVPVQAGDTISLDMGPLGVAELKIT